MGKVHPDDRLLAEELDGDGHPSILPHNEVNVTQTFWDLFLLTFWSFLRVLIATALPSNLPLRTSVKAPLAITFVSTFKESRST